MIPAKDFAYGFSSFWKEKTFNSEQVVRKLNLSVERCFDHIEGKTEPDRRGLINELAFQQAVLMARDEWPPKQLKPSSIGDSTIKETIKRIALLEGTKPGLISLPTNLEIFEVEEICYRILFFCTSIYFGGEPIFCPSFQGCGYLDSSEGDLIIGKTLFECKSGDRPFRSQDLRQLMVYAAQNYANSKYKIENLGVFNPRRGTYFVWPIEAISFEISGFPASELLNQIIYFVSSGDISR